MTDVGHRRAPFRGVSVGKGLREAPGKRVKAILGGGPLDLPKGPQKLPRPRSFAFSYGCFYGILVGRLLQWEREVSLLLFLVPEGLEGNDKGVGGAGFILRVY